MSELTLETAVHGNFGDAVELDLSNSSLSRPEHACKCLHNFQAARVMCTEASAQPSLSPLTSYSSWQCTSALRTPVAPAALSNVPGIWAVCSVWAKALWSQSNRSDRSLTARSFLPVISGWCCDASRHCTLPSCSWCFSCFFALRTCTLATPATSAASRAAALRRRG